MRKEKYRSFREGSSPPFSVDNAVAYNLGGKGRWKVNLTSHNKTDIFKM